MTVSVIIEGLSWLVLGAVLGAVYFFFLARGVAAMGAGADWRRATGYLVARIALAGGGFALAATQGALALIFMLAGLVLARTVAIRRVKGG